MNDDERRGKDEMNLAVLPIAKLGRSDARTSIEYYGTFSDKDGQKEMVWTVRGAEGLGLPNELGEQLAGILITSENAWIQKGKKASCGGRGQ